jgi:ankyrin repeat protein
MTIKSSLIDIFYQEDATALLCACMAGHIELIKYLIQHGAELNAQDKKVGTL